MSRRLHFEPIHGQLYRLPMHHWGRFSFSILCTIIHSLTNLYSPHARCTEEELRHRMQPPCAVHHHHLHRRLRHLPPHDSHGHCLSSLRPGHRALSGHWHAGVFSVIFPKYVAFCTLYPFSAFYPFWQLFIFLPAGVYYQDHWIDPRTDRLWFLSGPDMCSLGPRLR